MSTASMLPPEVPKPIQEPVKELTDEQKKELEPKKRVVGRPIEKGMRLNPGGRPKGVQEVRKLAQQFVPEVIMMMVDLMRDKDVKESVRLEAGKELYNRAYGRAEQSISVTHENKPVDLMTTEDIQRLLIEGILPRKPDIIDGEVINDSENP